MEFRKVNCAYHPTESITNFCAERECLLPLCPACISGHTQSHIDKSNLPKFDTINEVVRKVEESMDTYTRSFLQSKSRLAQLASKKQNFKKEVVEKLEQTKQRIIAKIEEKFQQLTKESLATIASNQAQLGVNNSQKIHELYQLADAELESLGEYRTNLRSENCLTYLIKYLSGEAAVIKGHLGVVQRGVQSGEQCQTKVDVNQNVFSELQNLVSRSVKINFILPNSHLRTVRPQSSEKCAVLRPPSPRHTVYQHSFNPIQNPLVVRLPNQSGRNFHPQGIRTIIKRPTSSYNQQKSAQNIFTQTMPTRGSPFSVVENRMNDSLNKTRERKGLTLYKTHNETGFS